MSAGAVIFERLRGATGAEGRVYPLTLPQAPTYPAVTYQQISVVRTHAMGQDGAVVRVRMQVDLWARTYAEVQAVATQVKGRLNRFRGAVDGVTVLDALLDNEMDGYESDAQARRVTQEYSIFLTTTA